MITVLALNPSIDITLSVNGFEFGGLNRVADSRRDAGGKGLNVAAAAAALGAETELVGFMHRNNADIFTEKLTACGVSSDFVMLDGDTRMNMKLRDLVTGKVTEINQSGASVTQDEIDLMTRKITEHCAHGGYVVLTGSLPPGCDTGYYACLVESLQSMGCRCVLDADGARLAAGIEAKPFLIKPNLYEFELLAGRPLASIEAIKMFALELVGRGVGIVTVSMGGDGAFITDGDSSYFAPAVDIALSSTVGAGDSMVAGLVAGLSEGKDLSSAFAMGIAAASAACMTEGTSLFEREVYTDILKRVSMRKI